MELYTQRFVRGGLRDVRRSYPSQAALARKLGVSQQTVRVILSGECFAGYRFCRAFAKLLGFPSAETLIATPHPPSPSAELTQSRRAA